jgi:hypothetical protein
VLELEEPVDGLELELVLAVEVEPELDTVEATLVVFTARVASAGSLPDTSCNMIPPEVARNIAAAIAAMRLRIALIRRLRARSRSATRPCAAGCGLARGAGLRAPPPGNGRAWLEASGGVIVTSISVGTSAMNGESPSRLATA